jgi:flagellin-like protein
MTTKKSMKKDERAVSPVIAVIMLIAITVIIAAVVAAFAYGIIGGVKKAPSAALVVEGAHATTNSQNVTIFHHGGDPITAAFKNAGTPDSIDDHYDSLQLRINGELVMVQEAYLNGNGTSSKDWGPAFSPGDQLTVVFPNGLNQSDSLVILHVPSENILQRITIS